MITIRFNMTAIATAGPKDVGKICSDAHAILTKIVGTKTEDVVPSDLGDIPESFRDSCGATVYILRRIRHWPDCTIVRVGYEAPTTLTISLAGTDTPYVALLENK